MRTSTLEPDALRLWATELQQVFPGATPEKLMEDHEAALRFLAERGVTSDTFDTEIAASVRAEMMQLEALAFSSNSLRTIRKETLRAAQRAPADIGPLQAQPDIDARLDAFWSAVRTS